MPNPDEVMLKKDGDNTRRLCDQVAKLDAGMKKDGDNTKRLCAQITILNEPIKKDRDNTKQLNKQNGSNSGHSKSEPKVYAWGVLYKSPNKNDQGVIKKLQSISKAIIELYHGEALSSLGVYLDTTFPPSKIILLYIRSRVATLNNIEDTDDAWHKISDKKAIIIPALNIMTEKQLRALSVASRLPYLAKRRGFYALSKLVDVWLSNPQSVIEASEITKNDTVYGEKKFPKITVEWALKFVGPSIYRDLVSSVTNKAAISLMREKFFRDHGVTKNLKPGLRFWDRYVDDKATLKEKHAAHIQTEKRKSNVLIDALKESADTLSELDAALHAFSFHAVVAGVVKKATKTSVTVELDRLGIYLKDTFNFESESFFPGFDGAPLGRWKYNPNKSKDTVWLDDGTFKKYRKMTNTGHDFFYISKNRLAKKEDGWDKQEFTLERPAPK